MQHRMNKYSVRREEISPGYAVLYGVAAGNALWLSIYPIDVIKSKLQTDSFSPATRKYSSMADAFRKVWGVFSHLLFHRSGCH